MATDTLCIGDFVCLYSEERHAYVHAEQSSTVYSEIGVWPRNDREKPVVPDAQVVTFELCVANKYKLNKKYRTLQAKSDTDPNDIYLKNQTSNAKNNADAENEDNVGEQKRQRGRQVLYGQIIQLRHIFTDKYIHISTTQTSRTESNNMQVDLHDYNAKHAQFRIMPRYKVKSEGDVVQVDDQIVLESVKSPGQYLHVSKTTFGQGYVYSDSHELNLSVSQSGFTICRRYKPLPEKSNKLLPSNPIRLYHKEVEAYMVAEGVFGQPDITEDVHFRVRKVEQNNPKTLYPSSSALTYWQIESEDGIINGGAMRWEQQCRIRHMTTRKYLAVDGNKKVILTDKMDYMTVFRLHPVIKELDEIEYETYCRIEHVMTGYWLHADQNDYVRKEHCGGQAKDTSMAGLQWTRASLKQITAIEEKQYNDAFTIQMVKPEWVKIFNYMAGMVPFLQKLISDKKDKGVTLTPKQAQDITTAFQEMEDFMIVNSVPSKNRQKLLRNLRIVEMLVQLLQINYRGTADKNFIVKIFVEAYELLYVYLMGNSRKNELYIAKHIPFFLGRIEFEGDTVIGWNAAHMVTELIRDNRKIVDRIGHEEIRLFVELLKQSKNYRYLDLLSVLCVCDGKSIPDNQTFITEVWLRAGAKCCVYHTELGQAIDNGSGKFKTDVVYVSTDNKRTWVALHDFAHAYYSEKEKKEKEKASFTMPTSNSLRPGTSAGRPVSHSGRPTSAVSIDTHKSSTNEEQFLFLEHQLDLFGKLCYGRNDFAIGVITRELKYLTWEEAFLCLTNEDLPDALRADYCSLIIALFVDVGQNVSVLDNINLTFVYDDVGVPPEKQSASGGTTPRSAETAQYFPKLKLAIEDFLNKNEDMTASLIGHNKLVEQVLCLIHYLVKYGYYGDAHDIETLLTPLLGLVDGRNDKEYPLPAGTTPLEAEHLKRTWGKKRYSESVENKSVVDAKSQAMDVLELFFNLRFNMRLERFVLEFKQTHRQANTQDQPTPDLYPLLLEKFSLEDSPSFNEVAHQKLFDMFLESSYFRKYDLPSIMLDLSNYQYDIMVKKSMYLLTRYYAAHANLFDRAVQAQVLVNPKSCAVLKQLRAKLPTLRRLATAKMSDEQTKEMDSILTMITNFCFLDSSQEEEHPMNQSIIYNHGILADLFDILSQDIDKGLMEQYSGLRLVFQKSFGLMRALAKNNPEVQERLFTRLDTLLNIEGAETEMAQALTEVFDGNKTTCLKIMPHQVQRIMALVAKHKEEAPEFLDLLNAIVKIEEVDLPLKRNQGYVMKYFMQYRQDVAMVIDESKEQWMTLLLTDDNPARSVFMRALVNVLATCAEGENRFIESICQTIFTVDDLLEIITHPRIMNRRKHPYLRFLLWVYMNTAGGAIESGSANLPHEQKLWEFLESLVHEFVKMTEFIKNNPEKATHLLKKVPPRKETGQVDYNHTTLYYIFEAVLPFLKVFFHTFYSPDASHPSYKSECVTRDKLANVLVKFVKEVGSLLSSKTYIERMVSCMSTVLTQANLSPEVMKEFKETYGSGAASADRTKSKARKKYEEEYEFEERLNIQLNLFANNYQYLYGGFNTVKHQLGGDILNEYTDLDGDEVLPLGKEFQKLVSCFIDERQPQHQKYAKAEKLLEQLNISSSQTQLTEKERMQQEELDVKCLQILRAIIYNEMVRLPEDWEGQKASRKILQKIKEAQDALNAHDGILVAMQLLSKPGDQIVREVLSFLGKMLFAGNQTVQASVLEYFTGTREEKFFFAVKSRMQMSAIATKEKRSLMTQHQAKLELDREQRKMYEKAIQNNEMAKHMLSTPGMGSMMSRASVGSTGRTRARPGRRLGSSLMKAKHGSHSSLNKSKASLGKPAMVVPYETKKNGVELKSFNKKEDKQPLLHGSNNKIQPQLEVKVEELADDADYEESPDPETDYKDEGYIGLVLQVLGLMCDKQFAGLQDYLRDQPDNIKSVDLVGETAKFLGLVYATINNSTISLVTEVFNTLVEFASGNMANQAVIFDNKVVDYINHILRTGHFQNCDLEKVFELKEAIVNLIWALVEENAGTIKGGHKGVAHEVVATVSVDSIHAQAMECYEMSLMPLSDAEQHGMDEDDFKRLKLKIEKVGFTFFHVVLRLHDLDGDKRSSKEVLMKTATDKNAWDFYSTSTMSIEVIKNNELQKVYFRVKDKTVLREEIKEKFKYEVDRSSPSNKLREFMVWSQEIMKDINYQRLILRNPIGKFFVKYWWHANMLVLWWSFLIAIMVLVGWTEPVFTNATGSYPIYHTAEPHFRWEGFDLAFYIMGGVHNLVSLYIVISYFLSNKPKFPKREEVAHYFRRCFCSSAMNEAESGHDDDDDDDPKSSLEVRFFSFGTVYYLMFMVFSILGTVFWGYFFSFHLLHLAANNQLLARVMKAITKNGLALIWVAILMIAVFYIYALISFALFRELFDSSKGLYCRNIGECLTTVIHRGLIIGVYEVFENAEVIGEEEFKYHLLKSIFDVSFFVIISTIGLNIVFGIIVDTFSELRDNKFQIEHDMNTTCFICSRSSYDFEHQAKGFDHHVKHEHNQWAYLHFFIHLSETRTNDFNALELYVQRLVEKQSYSFFPLNRALSLQNEDDSNEMMLEKLMEQVSYLVNKMKEEEATKQRELERKYQLEWEEQIKAQMHQKHMRGGGGDEYDV